MRQTITVQVEIEFNGIICSSDCRFRDYKLCALFDADINNVHAVRCQQCLEACKENKDDNN